MAILDICGASADLLSLVDEEVPFSNLNAPHSGDVGYIIPVNMGTIGEMNSVQSNHSCVAMRTPQIPSKKYAHRVCSIFPFDECTLFGPGYVDVDIESSPIGFCFYHSFVSWC